MPYQKNFIMDKITTFDLLVVYSERVATSANSLSKNVIAPFSKNCGSENYNLVYSYFLETCQKNNLKTAFTTSADIIGAGECQSYWLFKNKIWIKVRKKCFSKIIFDKFSPKSKGIKLRRKLFFSSKRIKPFNNPYIFNLCFDKQKTYDKFHKFSIPTIAINDNIEKEINKKCQLLKEKITNHPYRDDFTDEIIMKDRFGAGGRSVYKFKDNQSDSMTALIKKHQRISFIIQAFVKFDKGFYYQNSPVSTDIRLIYLGGKIVQTYIRMASKGNFLCNEHKGGVLKYIPKNKIPSKVIAVSKNIAEILGKRSYLIAFDFIISNNGNPYLLEANTGPGLDWNLLIKENEIESKKLIRIIIKEIARRINLSKNNFKRKTITTSPLDIPRTSEYPVLINSLATLKNN